MGVDFDDRNKITQETILEYTRITEILSPFSGLSHVNEKVLENACWRGTRVHQICQSIVEDLGEWDVEPELRGYITSFNAWYKKHPPILEVEKRYYCNDLQITGQVDLIVGDKNNAAIIDIKTPARPSRTWPIQGAAYAYLARRAGYNIRKIQFLQLFKDGTPGKIHEYEDCFPFFVKCLHVYRYFFEKKDRPYTDCNQDTKPLWVKDAYAYTHSSSASSTASSTADWGDSYEDHARYRQSVQNFNNIQENPLSQKGYENI